MQGRFRLRRRRLVRSLQARRRSAVEFVRVRGRVGERGPWMNSGHGSEVRLHGRQPLSSEKPRLSEEVPGSVMKIRTTEPDKEGAADCQPTLISRR